MRSGSPPLGGGDGEGGGGVGCTSCFTCLLELLRDLALEQDEIANHTTVTDCCVCCPFCARAGPSASSWRSCATRVGGSRAVPAYSLALGRGGALGFPGAFDVGLDDERELDSSPAAVGIVAFDCSALVTGASRSAAAHVLLSSARVIRRLRATLLLAILLWSGLFLLVALL